MVRGEGVRLRVVLGVHLTHARALTRGEDDRVGLARTPAETARQTG